MFYKFVCTNSYSISALNIGQIKSYQQSLSSIFLIRTHSMTEKNLATYLHLSIPRFWQDSQADEVAGEYFFYGGDVFVF